MAVNEFVTRFTRKLQYYPVQKFTYRLSHKNYDSIKKMYEKFSKNPTQCKIPIFSIHTSRNTQFTS